MGDSPMLQQKVVVQRFVSIMLEDSEYAIKVACSVDDVWIRTPSLDPKHQRKHHAPKPQPDSRHQFPVHERFEFSARNPELNNKEHQSPQANSQLPHKLI